LLNKIKLKNNNKIEKIYFVFDNIIIIKLYKFVYKIFGIDLFKYKNKNYIDWNDWIENVEMDRIKKNIIDY
jgi:hypothetical protein